VAEKLPLRLAVYLDDTYREQDGAVYGNRAFVLFLGGVAERIESLLLLGRLDPAETRSHYRVPDGVDFAALPPYPSLVHVGPALMGMLRSLRRFWRLLDEVDAVWLLGPHPLALAFALIAALRRRGVALGVRQDWPTLVRNRHPRRRWVHAVADLLESAYRLLARRVPTVVVGPQVAEHYSRAPRLLEISVSLVREEDLIEPAPHPWSGRLLSVGRLDTEKNPLLMAEILRLLVAGGGDWRLTICGEGPLEAGLRERLRELGVEDRAELVGYLPLHGGLLDLYRSSDALLHVSLTEGLPQVLLEAFAAGLPVVATAVGGVPGAVGEAGLLVPPDDAQAAAASLARLAGDQDLRQSLSKAALERVRERTLEAESARVAEFLSAGAGRRPGG
jgi:glycosyltransferase involved in cell wall biosynthesis